MWTKSRNELKQFFPEIFQFLVFTSIYWSLPISGNLPVFGTSILPEVLAKSHAENIVTYVNEFLFKCLDTERFHFAEGDTDSAYFAVSGDSNEDCNQGFKAIIKDREFYDKYGLGFFMGCFFLGWTWSVPGS